jgi:hypothetical protein
MGRCRKHHASRSPLPRDQRAAVQRFLQVLKPFDEAKASELFEATRRRYAAFAQAQNVAQLVVQLHLKRVENGGRRHAGKHCRLHAGTDALRRRVAVLRRVLLLRRLPCSAALAGLDSEADWMSERLAAVTPGLSRIVEQELK